MAVKREYRAAYFVLFLHFVVNPIACTKLCAVCALKK